MSRFPMAIGRIGAALAAVALVAGMSDAAMAQPHRDRRPPPPRHIRHRPPPPPAWGYDQRTYVAAPPPVVYAPPAPPAGINLGLMFNIR